MTTTAHQRNPDQEQRASLALNELAAARDAILTACELERSSITHDGFRGDRRHSQTPPTTH